MLTDPLRRPRLAERMAPKVRPLPLVATMGEDGARGATRPGPYRSGRSDARAVEAEQEYQDEASEV